MAEAMYLGVALPAVELIQVGDVYFVRDGHHRISVAKALGQTEIEAHVTLWRVAGACPRRRTPGIVHLTRERIGLLARSGFPTWPM